MSKKLDSILSRVPPATVSSTVVTSMPEKVTQVKQDEISVRYSRIVAVVPAILKQEIKMYLATHPEDTEKTLILKGLKKIGFNVPEEEIVDQRGRKEVIKL